MKEVPFYPNTEDDLHCMQSVYASIIEYFQDEKLDWTELDQLTGFQPGRTAWSVEALTKLVARGFDIQMIEPFDYERFMHEGSEYLGKIYGDEEVEYALRNTNILEIKPLIPTFLEVVKPECRIATLDDIDTMLDEGRLVSTILNARVLNKRTGYAGHAVLIFAKEGDEYIIHDPGLPPRPNLRVDVDLLMEARGGENSPHEVTGIKIST